MSGTTAIACPKCGVKLRLKGEVAGRKIECPKCHAAFRISGKSSAAPSSSSGSKPQKPVAPIEPPAARGEPPAARKSTSKTPAKRRKKKPASASAQQGADSDRKAAPRKKKRKRPQEDFDFADDFADDFASELDDFGDPIEDDYGGADDQDPYSAAPVKRKSRGKKKSKKGTKRPTSGFQASLNGMGTMGWILCGSVAGILGIVFTTLGGMIEIGFVVAFMAVVTGAMVGGAIRFAAVPISGPAPAVTSVVIAIAAIMLGKVGAFYIWSGAMLDNEMGGWSIEDIVAAEASEPALISQIADEVLIEWQANGQLPMPPEVPLGEEMNFEDYEDYEDYEEGEPIDHSARYPPAVWEEATKRWNAKPEDERSRLLAEAEQQVREEYADYEDVGEAVDEGMHRFKWVAALIAAFINTFYPAYAAPCLIAGVYAAFRLAADSDKS